eukprot:2167888-Pyramimonas_sp.AAC.1
MCGGAAREVAQSRQLAGRAHFHPVHLGHVQGERRADVEVSLCHIGGKASIDQTLFLKHRDF